MTEKKYDIKDFPMIFHGYDHLPELTLGSSDKNEPVSNRQGEQIDWKRFSSEATKLLEKFNHEEESFNIHRINLPKTLLNYSSFGEPLEERLIYRRVKPNVKSHSLNILLIDTSNSMRSIFSKINVEEIINNFISKPITENVEVTMFHDTNIYDYKWGKEFTITGCRNGTSFSNPLKSIHQCSDENGVKVRIFHLSDGGVDPSEWKDVKWLTQRIDYYYGEMVNSNKKSNFYQFLESHLKSEKIWRKNMVEK